MVDNSNILSFFNSNSSLDILSKASDAYTLSGIPNEADGTGGDGKYKGRYFLFRKSAYTIF